MPIYRKIIYIFVIMFSFFNTGNAEYKKVFFDFDIKDINDEKLNLSIYNNGLQKNHISGLQ